MTCRRRSVWSAAVVNRPLRASVASGGSETQQNQPTLERRASGVNMLTSPPVAVRVTQAPSCQTKSLGPRLATMTMPVREDVNNSKVIDADHQRASEVRKSVLGTAHPYNSRL